METTIDSVGRVVIPKPLRDAFGLTPGSTVDISAYGSGIQITPGGRTAQVIEENGEPVLKGEGVLTDEMMYALIDAGRR